MENDKKNRREDNQKQFKMENKTKDRVTKNVKIKLTQFGCGTAPGNLVYLLISVIYTRINPSYFKVDLISDLNWYSRY